MVLEEMGNLLKSKEVPNGQVPVIAGTTHAWLNGEVGRIDGAITGGRN